MRTDLRRAGGHNACNAENNLRGGDILRVVDRQGQTHWAINHYEGVLIRDPNRGQVGCQLGTPPIRKAAIQARRGNWRRARFDLCKPATNSEASAIDRLLARARGALALRGPTTDPDVHLERESIVIVGDMGTVTSPRRSVL